MPILGSDDYYNNEYADPQEGKQKDRDIIAAILNDADTKVTCVLCDSQIPSYYYSPGRTIGNFWPVCKICKEYINPSASFEDMRESIGVVKSMLNESGINNNNGK